MELAKEVSRIPFVVVGCKQDVRNDCAQSMTVPKDEVYIMIFESVFILHLTVICLQTDLKKDSKLSFNFFHQP